MKQRLVHFLLTACLIAGGLTAHAAEVIHNYDSDIVINKDGSMVVTETITVTAEGNNIRRGIYRTFPTQYKDKHNNNVNVEFDMLSATRDGQPENWRSEKHMNGVRVYLGRADYFLPTNQRYTYTLTYRTNFQLGYFDTFDEIYWNAVGQDWNFPIRKASATVQLPGPVGAGDWRIAAYSGQYGSTATQVTWEVTAAEKVRFETVKPLRPNEGMTIAVGFPKGIVNEPSGAAKIQRFLLDNLGILIGLLGTAGILVFYIKSWQKAGKDPTAGVVIPRYEPPEGYSPASLRYIWRMKYDSTCLAAALVNLAVKEVVELRKEGWLFSKKFIVRKTDKPTKSALAPGEHTVYSKLLTGKQELEFKKSNHSRIKGALDGHKRAMRRDFLGKYFVLNGNTMIIGMVLSIVTGVAMLLLGALKTPIGLGIIAVLFLMFVLFSAWMKAPTMHGRKVMDHIEGLRLYLGVAEKQDLERQQEPPKTFEEFEKLLPYAVALNCANTWVDKFDSVLKSMQASGEMGRRGWMIDGSGFTADSITNSVNAISSNLSSSISSSSSPPGSSSGSGGGGFSGGGGGGGGGGGW